MTREPVTEFSSLPDAERLKALEYVCQMIRDGCDVGYVELREVERQFLNTHNDAIRQQAKDDAQREAGQREDADEASREELRMRSKYSTIRPAAEEAFQM